MSSQPMTVYVGKLQTHVDNETVRAMLQFCGMVQKWNRAIDADTNQPKGFGFCTFTSADGAIKACKVLNGFKLEGQEMLVKVGKKEQEVIDKIIEAKEKAGVVQEYDVEAEREQIKVSSIFSSIL